MNKAASSLAEGKGLPGAVRNEGLSEAEGSRNEEAV